MASIVHCLFAGRVHSLRVLTYDVSQSPIVLIVDPDDVIAMLPDSFIAGSAYASFPWFDVLRQAEADFKIRSIEKIDKISNTAFWRYSFVDHLGRSFSTTFNRSRHGSDKSIGFKGQSSI